MTVDYDVTVADLVAFNLFHVRHSPALQKQWLTTRIVYSALTALLSLAGIYLLPRAGEPLTPFAVIIAVAGGLVMYFWYPRLALSAVRRNTEKLLREGRNQGMVGEQQLTFNEDELRCVSASGTATLKWSSIEKIVPAADRVYIYVSAVSALIVPARAFASAAAFDAFAQRAQQYFQAHVPISAV